MIKLGLNAVKSVQQHMVGMVTVKHKENCKYAAIIQHIKEPLWWETQVSLISTVACVKGEILSKILKYILLCSWRVQKVEVSLSFWV